MRFEGFSVGGAIGVTAGILPLCSTGGVKELNNGSLFGVDPHPKDVVMRIAFFLNSLLKKEQQGNFSAHRPEFVIRLLFLSSLLCRSDFQLADLFKVISFWFLLENFNL